jgi:arylsulfatase A-like enzyme
MKSLRLLMLLVAVLAALALPSAAAAQEAKRPNVIVIVSDDQGYADVGVYGCKDIPTPNFDSLAKNGVRCTNGYVSGPYCSPTRAGLMTGRYQQRYGHEFNPGPAARAPADFGLPLREVTLADRFKAAGYKTGLVGKWHLGYTEKFHPTRRGFDEFFGFLGGAHSYVDSQADKTNPIQRGTTAVDEKEYLTDAFTREAAAFIEKHQKEPFLLFLTYNAVHAPMQATDKYLKRFDKIADVKRKTYAAMLSAMDDGIGVVLERLRKCGLEENTLIFFISDNGGPPVNSSSNGPLRGYKAQTFEGGIRVPFLVQWKGKLPAGKTFDQPVIQLDIFPTALAAANVKTPADALPLDGVNLLPYLTGENTRPPHDVLYWRFGPQLAIRQGNFKLVKGPGNSPMQLYDLAADIGEKDDLSAKMPDKVKELEAAWKKWDAQLVKPLWGGPPAGKAVPEP